MQEQHFSDLIRLLTDGSVWFVLCLYLGSNCSKESGVGAYQWEALLPFHPGCGEKVSIGLNRNSSTIVIRIQFWWQRRKHDSVLLIIFSVITSLLTCLKVYALVNSLSINLSWLVLDFLTTRLVSWVLRSVEWSRWVMWLSPEAGIVQSLKM